VKLIVFEEVRGKPGPSKKAKSEYTLQKIDDVNTDLLKDLKSLLRTRRWRVCHRTRFSLCFCADLVSDLVVEDEEDDEVPGNSSK